MEYDLIVDDNKLKWIIRKSSKIGNCTQDRLGPNKREEYNFEIAYKEADKNSIFVDVGAHVGSFTINMSKHYKYVYAFEPQGYNFLGLQKNIKLNELENVFAFQMAIGDKAGNISMDRFGGGAKIKDYNGGIPLVPLDNINFQDKIKVIKIDTEGFEEQVLLGAKETIKKHKPILLIETHLSIIPDQIERLTKILTEMNYSTSVLYTSPKTGDFHWLATHNK